MPEHIDVTSNQEANVRAKEGGFNHLWDFLLQFRAVKERLEVKRQKSEFFLQLSLLSAVEQLAMRVQGSIRGAGVVKFPERLQGLLSLLSNRVSGLSWRTKLGTVHTISFQFQVQESMVLYLQCLSNVFMTYIYLFYHYKKGFKYDGRDIEVHHYLLFSAEIQDGREMINE